MSNMDPITNQRMDPGALKGFTVHATDLVFASSPLITHFNE